MASNVRAALFWVAVCCVFISDALAAQCYRTFSKQDFPNCKLLDGTYALHWKLDGGNVTFALDVDQSPSGWIGLGSSQTGGMKSADIWVVQKNSAGVWTVQDMHSEEYVTPVMDTKQDVSLVSAPITNGNSIAAVITRKLDSCDVSDMTLLANMSIPFIWAHGASPSLSYHAQSAGSTQIILAATGEAEDLSGYQVWTARMDNFAVPAAESSFWCSNFEAPADRKYHWVAAEYNTTDLVHHMILFACTTKPSAPLGQFYECPDMPAECTKFQNGWAPGVGRWSAPQEAGLPMVQYYALQMHYTNIDRTAGRRDSSGFLVYYTPQLRQYDMGVMILGQTNLTIAPGLPAHAVDPGVCHSSCTRKFTGPLKLDGHAFHMHQTGKTMVTKVIREGREVAVLDHLSRYDYNHQRYAAPWAGADVLLPGDTLITTCTFDSTSRTNVTRYGETTFDEMCFDFLLYYPAQSVDICLSAAYGVSSCFNSTEEVLWEERVIKEIIANLTANASADSRPAQQAAQQVVLDQAEGSGTTNSTGTGAGSTAGTGAGSSTGNANDAEEQLPAELRDLVTQQIVQLGLERGSWFMYNESEMRPGGEGYTPLATACPPFLSAADNGGSGVAGVPAPTPAPAQAPAAGKEAGSTSAASALVVVGSGWAMLLCGVVAAVLQL